MNMGMTKLFNIVRAVLLAAMIISVSVTAVLAFRPLYYSAVERYDIEEMSGMDREEIIENYDALIEYNLLGGPERLDFPTLSSSEEGLIHFAEVKRIFVGLQITGIVSGLLLALSLLAGRLTATGFSGANPYRRGYGWLKYGGIIACALPITVMTGAALWWDKVFVLFHEIMFDNDYWIFDAEEDSVITMLPDEFFFECCIAIGAVIFTLSAAAYLIYRKLRKGKNAY